MTYSRAVVERAGELRRSGLSCREIARELDGPSKSAVARWTRAGAAGGTVGRAVAKMDLPKVVGDGPVYPDIDPDDKDALIERLVLENAVLRAVNDVLKAASLDGMSNREKTLVIDRLRPCGKWSLRELTSSLGISKSSYEYQRRAIARPDRRAPLRALVRRIFTEDGEGARGYRFVTARLRELDEPVRVSEKVVLRIMREEGLVPRWMRRKRRPYSSYAVLASIYFSPFSPTYFRQSRQRGCAGFANADAPLSASRLPPPSRPRRRWIRPSGGTTVPLS